MKEYVSSKEGYIVNIQQSCLEIAIVIDQLCKDNHIDYSLCGGSVIGAHIFDGFIPWDDDIDIMMTRNNYDRFLEKFESLNSDRFRLLNYRKLHKVDVPTLFTRIEDLKCQVLEEIAGNIREGHVFVDITVMDNINSYTMHKQAQLYGSYVYSNLYKYNGMMPGTWWKKALFSILKINNNENKILKMYHKFENFCATYKDEDCEYCAELLSSAYSKQVYHRSLFNHYKRVKFEDTELMIVENYEDYLFERYGRREFSREVPEDQRVNSHIIGFKNMVDD